MQIFTQSGIMYKYMYTQVLIFTGNEQHNSCIMTYFWINFEVNI